jgi:sugar lactone lactonase YvrE
MKFSERKELVVFESVPLAMTAVGSAGLTLYVALDSGEIVKGESANLFESGDQAKKFTTYSRVPNSTIGSLAMDSSGFLILADSSSKCLLKAGGKSPSVFVDNFDGEDLNGPNGVAICGATGVIAFTDGGSSGDSGLHRPVGSVFISTEMGILVPILYRISAQPVSLAFSSSGDFLYVAEKATNRVIRFARVGQSWEGCVFSQLAGGCGPVSVVTTTEHKVLVAHSDIPNGRTPGKITVFNESGEIENVINDIPSPDITCMTLSPDGLKLIVTTACNKTAYYYDISIN